jgi:hypothetical protein
MLRSLEEKQKHMLLTRSRVRIPWRGQYSGGCCNSLVCIPHDGWIRCNRRSFTKLRIINRDDSEYYDVQAYPKKCTTT